MEDPSIELILPADQIVVGRLTPIEDLKSHPNYLAALRKLQEIGRRNHLEPNTPVEQPNKTRKKSRQNSPRELAGSKTTSPEFATPRLPRRISGVLLTVQQSRDR